MARKPLSQVLPPLILGTGTFNVQFHPDPARMPYTDIVRHALSHGVTAFDTSPYYGPSETLLGSALAHIAAPRDSYFLITKTGRVGPAEFDYSPAWVRYSVCRSLERLGTEYLDLVYMHDAEFMSPAEVVGAVTELRRLRDEGRVRYVGISGYPVDKLASLAEAVLRETGEPLDAAMSYANFTIQNRQLGTPSVLEKLRAAGVGCVPNASLLGMGLLTTRGVDNGPMASWHPAPSGLRSACYALKGVVEENGERMEEVAIRWAMENWFKTGAEFGTSAYPAELVRDLGDELPARVGASVMGIMTVDELDEARKLWRSVASGRDSKSDKVARLADEMRPKLGEWKDFAWESGGPGFKNENQNVGEVPQDEVSERWGLLPKTGS